MIPSAAKALAKRRGGTPIPPPSPPDPLFDYVRALVSFDGNLTDVKGHSFTLVDAAALTTSIKKFGSGAAQVTGGAVQGAASPDFILTGDFCAELWVEQSASLNPNAVLSIGSFSDGVLVRNIFSAGQFDSVYVNGMYTSQATALFPNDGTLRHVCIERFGSVVTTYVEGVVVNTITGVTGTVNSAGLAILLGASYHAPAERMVGVQDEFRLTAYARYRGPFTPPAAAFGRSAPENGPNWGGAFDLTVSDNTGVVLSNGGLNASVDGNRTARTANSWASGTHYIEAMVNYTTSTGPIMGINAAGSNSYAAPFAGIWVKNNTTVQIISNGVFSADIALAVDKTDRIGFKFDADAHTLTLYKNDVAIPTGVISSIPAGGYRFCVCSPGGGIPVSASIIPGTNAALNNSWGGTFDTGFAGGGSATYSNGNLTVAFSGGAAAVRTQNHKASGKGYFEFKLDAHGSTYGPIMGIMKAGNNSYAQAGSYSIWAIGPSTLYFANGDTGGVAYGGGVVFATTDTVGVKLDQDAQTLTFYKNGVSLGAVPTVIPPGDYYGFAQTPGSSYSQTITGTFTFGSTP